ncbi:MAG TPA: efflux transporter periplasmic adaptor subunit, partial [Candidatus Saccharimonadia bacterium]|nr:efflux transporter periplasmic adaptor subunit [Candidatus Saccharimonadia bacterium]
LALDNDDLALRPGMFVRVGVSFDQIAAATLVPKAAVIADAQRNRVFVVEGNVVDERVVLLGHEIGSLVQVLSGLEAGARVVTTGQSALKDGDKVAVVNAPPPEKAIAANDP